MGRSSTPGPWEATDDGDIRAFVPEYGCRMSLIGDGEISDPADAKLMAAAPDMIALLRKIAGVRYVENVPLDDVIDLLKRIDGE